MHLTTVDTWNVQENKHHSIDTQKIAKATSKFERFLGKKLSYHHAINVGQ